MKDLTDYVNNVGKTIKDAGKYLTRKSMSYALAVGAIGALGSYNANAQLTPRYVDVEVSGNANQNALNWQNAARTSVEEGEELIVRLPNAIYDLNGINAIRLSYGIPNIKHEALSGSSPIPKDPLTHTASTDFPTTGAIVRDEVSLADGTHLKNVIFDGRGADAPYVFIKPGEPNIIIENCYFAGNKDQNLNYRAIETVISSQGMNVTGCYIDNFKYGMVIDNLNSKIRNTTSKNSNYTAIMNASADWGTETDPGNNLFILENQGQLAATPMFAIITSGAGFPMQWNYWYTENADGSTTQLKTEGEVLGYIDDKRLTGQSLLKKVKLQAVGNDVYILPMHTTPHPSEKIITNADGMWMSVW